RPILRFRAAGAGMDSQNGVALIVLAGELHAHLDLSDLRLELSDDGFDIGFDVLSVFLQLEENVQLFGFRVQGLADLDALLDTRSLPADFLRCLRLVPKTGDGHLSLDLCQRPTRGLQVKDSSGRTAGVPGARQSSSGCRRS